MVQKINFDAPHIDAEASGRTIEHLATRKIHCYLRLNEQAVKRFKGKKVYIHRGSMPETQRQRCAAGQGKPGIRRSGHYYLQQLQ